MKRAMRVGIYLCEERVPSLHHVDHLRPTRSPPSPSSPSVSPGPDLTSSHLISARPGGQFRRVGTWKSGALRRFKTRSTGADSARQGRVTHPRLPHPTHSNHPSIHSSIHPSSLTPLPIHHVLLLRTCQPRLGQHRSRTCKATHRSSHCRCTRQV